MNTSDGLTKAMSSANMRNLLTVDTFRIVTEETQNAIRKKRPAPTHYIVTLKQFSGERIWTLTSDERLARGEVHIDIWCWAVSLPVIQINRISMVIQNRIRNRKNQGGDIQRNKNTNNF